MHHPLLLEHFRNPRNAGELEDADAVGEAAIHDDLMEERADRVVGQPDRGQCTLDYTSVHEQELRVRRERVARERDVVQPDAQVRVRQRVELEPGVLDSGRW